MRGHGDTTVPVQGMSVENVVGDIKKVLAELYGEAIPQLVLVGHSMGGAMAIHATLALPKGKVQALVVLDVVEGTAVEALPNMMKIVYARPQKFADVKSAIFWAVSNNIVRNTESASVSIPPQLREEDGAYYWKTDLEETSKHWKEWFTNMSNLFLSASAMKLLILAGVDRLDGALTMAQMQGKF
jgi:pimeloyl-ACP methyl ester carboxylesterase